MVHAFSLGGYNIVLDVNSGLVHVVDEIVFQIVSKISQITEAGQDPASCDVVSDETVDEVCQSFKDMFPQEDLEEVSSEIKELIKGGELFSPDPYKKYYEHLTSYKTDIKALCLSVAHDCNLACRYCFADEGEYKGERGLMSFEVGKKALDFLIASSGTRRNLEVDFFGGEPLMNFEVVRQLVAYGRSIEKKYNKNFRFTLTTNAVLLDDEITEFLNKEMSNVVLSLDGRRSVNDKMRVTRNGKGSYDIVVPRIQRFIEKRGDKDHYVRGTFTENNLDFVKDIEEYLDLGFKNLSLEPVVTTESYGIKEEDLPKIMEEYEKLAELYIKKRKEGDGFTFFHYMIDLDGGPCAIKRLKGCGSGNEYVAVTPAGEIYPCHQFIGQREFIIGDVDNGITRPDIIEEFRKACVYTKNKCDKCFAKFYCSGGCPANSWNFSKDINKVYEIGCEMQKKRVECALMIKAALADEE